MRTSILLFTLQLITGVLAQQSPTFGEYLTRFPACATECAVPVIDHLGNRNGSTAEISTALCIDVTSMRRISGCVQINCSHADATAAWPFQRELCSGYPVPTQAAYIRNLTMIMAAIASIFVVLRLYSRTIIVRSFGWDDWNVVVAAGKYNFSIVHSALC
ncbi:hypothetical protein WAI453_007169 [Rhynchosporium graminicola]